MDGRLQPEMAAMQLRSAILAYAFGLFLKSVDVKDIPYINSALQFTLDGQTPENTYFLLAKHLAQLENKYSELITPEDDYIGSERRITHQNRHKIRCLLNLARLVIVKLASKNVSLSTLATHTKFYIDRDPHTAETDSEFQQICVTFNSLNNQTLSKEEEGPSSFLHFDMKFLEAFYTVFERANSTSQENHRRDFLEFLITNLTKLTNLNEMLGSKTFPFLNGLIGTSVLKLERFLDEFQLIDVVCVPFMAEIFANKPLSVQHTEIFLLQVPLFPKLADEIGPNAGQTILETLKTISKDPAPLHVITTRLNRSLLDRYIQALGFTPTDVNYDLVVTKLTLHSMTNLLSGRRQMEKNYYKGIFDDMLRADLSSTTSFEEFTMNTEQDSLFGKSLAKHNNRIKKTLVDAGIRTDLAFNYPRKICFTYAGDSTTNINQTLWSLYQNLRHISKIILNLSMNEVLSKSLRDALTNLKKTIDRLQQQINKGRDSIIILQDDVATLKKLCSQASTDLLVKITSAIDQIRACHDLSSAAFTEYNEFTSHFQENLHSLSTSLASEDLLTVNLKPAKRFRVEQWDKSQINTFFLGNYLSCCLATDHDRFPAMVQRRMDKAMFMHVVIDESTQLPVCGNWLFFAEDKSDKSKIYVVANFFEIRAGIGMQHELRDLLVNQLLHFTGNMFTADVNAQGFLMSHLGYGSIPDFKGYEQIEIHIQKVGGYLALNENNTPNQAKESYYLVSVDSTNFHKFSPERLKANFKSPVSVTELSVFTQPPTTSASPAIELAALQIPGL